MATLQQVIDRGLRIDYGDIFTSPLRLDTQLVTELQSVLARANFYQEPVDGIFGRFTQSALRAFKQAHSLGGGDVLGPTTASLLLHCRDCRMQPSNPTTREEHQRAIIAECKRLGLSLNNQIAYVLATVEHETANSFRPVKEAFFLGEPAGERHRMRLPYYPYFGRGYVQLTLRDNYAKYSRLLGIDLVAQPDLALEAGVALFVLVDGMKNGRFTGHKLGHYCNAERNDFVGARNVINPGDRHGLVANLAQGWLAQLNRMVPVG